MLAKATYYFYVTLNVNINEKIKKFLLFFWSWRKKVEESNCLQNGKSITKQGKKYNAVKLQHSNIKLSAAVLASAEEGRDGVGDEE